MNRKPWERRLEDLAHILESCGATYFDPDLFRRNTNQFLQTARTVTFLIQKNKANIPGFVEWYQKNVIDAWEEDKLMQWAKDARNTIEKEGDLELNSELHVTLIFSYLEEEDIKIECGRDELLNAGVKKLIRFAQKKLPTGVSDAAAIKIERLWKTSKLTSHELLCALGYVYSRLFDCCWSLADHLGSHLPAHVLDPSEIDAFCNSVRKVQLVKLRDLQTYRFATRAHKLPEEDELPASVKDNAKTLIKALGYPTDFESTVNLYAGMAEVTFNQWGNHIPMLFLLGRDWSIQDMRSPSLEDQADKYLFWRALAESIKLQNPHGLFYIAEAWVRDLRKYPSLPIRNLPIRGEILKLVALDRDRNITIRSWPIERMSGNALPRLGPVTVADKSDQKAFFLVPVMRSMGMEPDFIQKWGYGKNSVI